MANNFPALSLRYSMEMPIKRVLTERSQMCRRLLYRLKRRWRDGTTHVIFEPLELIEKLAASEIDEASGWEDS